MTLYQSLRILLTMSTRTKAISPLKSNSKMVWSTSRAKTAHKTKLPSSHSICQISIGKVTAKRASTCQSVPLIAPREYIRIQQPIWVEKSCPRVTSHRTREARRTSSSLHHTRIRHRSAQRSFPKSRIPIKTWSYLMSKKVRYRTRRPSLTSMCPKWLSLLR